MVDKLHYSLHCSNACGHETLQGKLNWKQVYVAFLLYPWAFSKFVFNHRILAMIFLTGNFLNAVDRDGLHGSVLDPMLLSASDKTRLGLSYSECLEWYSFLIIPLVIWILFVGAKFIAIC